MAWPTWRELDAWLQDRGINVPAPTTGQTYGGTHAVGSLHYRDVTGDNIGDLGRDYSGASAADVARALVPYAQGENRVLDELFYSPLNIFYDDGRQFTPSSSLRSTHQDHTHVGLRANRSASTTPRPTVSPTTSAPPRSVPLAVLFIGGIIAVSAADTKAGPLVAAFLLAGVVYNAGVIVNERNKRG